MKVLVCKNKHCRNNESESVLKKLKTLGVEFTHSSCMDMCETGPNVFTFPELKMYGNVSVNRVEDIISGNADDLQYSKDELADEIINEEYIQDPMHRRTIKLFRWHLTKYDNLTPANLRKIISEFKNKYDIKGIKFEYPIKYALIKTIKGPDLPKLIHYLEKDETVKLFDNFLKKAQPGR